METNGMSEVGEAVLEVCQAVEDARQQVIQNLKEMLQPSCEDTRVDGTYLDDGIYRLYQ